MNVNDAPPSVGTYMHWFGFAPSMYGGLIYTKYSRRVDTDRASNPPQTEHKLTLTWMLSRVVFFVRLFSSLRKCGGFLSRPVRARSESVYGHLPFCKHFVTSGLGYDCTRIFGLLIEFLYSGHNGLFARLLLIALTCSRHRGFVRFCKRRFDLFSIS